MAESRGSLLAKSVQKHAGRAKEKILQNLGKVDRTADDIFDEHLQNFTRQQNAANRLQKEFNNYIRCVRAVQVASKSLLEAIGDIYESQWSGHDMLYVQTQSIDNLWQDFSHKLADQVLIPLNTYQSQFPEMRKKIDKRGRKLVDYDGQRHNFQALQTSMAKKRDEQKISRGRELLEEAKRTYEMLNSELHDELPALHDSRILFLVTNLQTLFTSEQVFHAETAKIYGELEEIVDKLATESQRGSYSVKKSNGTSLSIKAINDKNSSLVAINNISPRNSSVPTDDLTTNAKVCNSSTPNQNQNDLERSSSIISSNNSSPSSPISKLPQFPTTTTTTNTTTITTTTTTPDSPQPPKSPPSINKTNSSINGTSETATNNKDKDDDDDVDNVQNSKTYENLPNETNPIKQDSNSNKRMEDLYDIPAGASTDNLPPGVLYRVKATYKYTREDVDELSFEVGEIISVIEYDDPEEQEEGWLMGVKDHNGEKGMFPANFTKPL